MVADIFNKVNLGSVTANSTGSTFNVNRLARKSVYVSILTNSSGTSVTDPTINIESSANGSTWFNLDSKTYESGTATGMDIFSYNSDFQFMRTTLTNVSGTVNASTTLTGRGV